ncbi:MAG: hypothetical protein JSV04_01525, partial [Candidatus Heimdallarchaeota archaeon]
MENKGQKTEAIYYYTENSQMAVGFGINGIKFNIISSGKTEAENDEPLEEEITKKKGTYTTIQLEFIGSNNIIPIAEKPTGRYNNYFIGSQETKWVVSFPKTFLRFNLKESPPNQLNEDLSIVNLMEKAILQL